MQTFFKDKENIDPQVVVDVGNSTSEESQLISQIVNKIGGSEKAKQFIKVFLDQAKCTALGGAVAVNHVILALTLMGYKLTVEHHKHLEYLLIGYWGLRGGTAALLELTGLKNKAPDAISVYTLTEKNIIRILAFTSFIRNTHLTISANAAFQLGCAGLLVKDQFCSAKALVEGKTYPSGGHFEKIKDYFEGHQLLTALAVAEEMGSRAIQLGATTYTAGYALADVFVDSVSPIDPANQEQILMSLALVMAILGALSVAHPITTKIANQVRAAEINAGLILLPIVSFLFDFIPNIDLIAAGAIALVLVVMIPALLEFAVSYWDYQNEMISRQPVNEMHAAVEEVIDEDLVEERLNINC